MRASKKVYELLCCLWEKKRTACTEANCQVLSVVRQARESALASIISQRMSVKRLPALRASHSGLAIALQRKVVVAQYVRPLKQP